MLASLIGLSTDPAYMADLKNEIDAVPDAYRMAVVDEDRRAAGLGVRVGGQAADVPAVAHRQQREDGDLRVLGGVQRAEQHLQGKLLGEHVGAELVPKRLRLERRLRQV